MTPGATCPRCKKLTKTVHLGKYLCKDCHIQFGQTSGPSGHTKSLRANNRGNKRQDIPLLFGEKAP